MIEVFGINVIVPIVVFLWIIVGSNVIAGAALNDVVERRKQS